MPQNNMLLKSLRRSAALLVLLPALAFAQAPEAAESDENNPKRPGNATVRPETDDATKRRDAMRAWYETPMTPAYMRFLNDAAARERARNGHLLPSTTDSAETQSMTEPTSTTSSTTAPAWINLGPTGAKYLENGSYRLPKTDSGRVVEIVPHPKDPNILYVAMSGGGVWKSMDAATASQPTWTPKTEDLGSLSCGALAMDTFDPEVLYLGLGDSFDGTGIGLVKSTDGGTTWATPVYLGSSTKITEIKVAQVPDNNIVLVATDKGLFRSTNGGADFSLSSKPLPLATGSSEAPYVWSIAWAGGTNYALTLEARPSVTSGTTDGQVWHSADNGATWTRASGPAKSTGVGRMTIASSPKNRLVMYAQAAIPNSSASTDLADFFRSSDGGKSWTAMNATARKVTYTNRNTESSGPSSILNGQGWYNQLVIPSHDNTGTVFFGGALLLAKASNALATPSYTQMTNWLAQFGLPYVHADFHAGAYDALGKLYVGTDGGIFKLQDDGTWTDKYNIGIASHLLYSVGSSDNNADAIIGGLQDNGTRVREGGTGIYNQELGGDGFGAAIHPSVGSTMLGSLYYTRIYKSTDGGLNFSSSSTGITESGGSSAPFHTRIVPSLGDPMGNTVFTHTNLKVYRSTNFGGSWSALGTSGFITSGALRNVGVAASNGNVIGAVASGGRVYLSSNGGSTWAEPARPLPNHGLSLSSIWFDTERWETVYVASVAPDSTKNHLWKSTDFGANWTTIDGNGLPPGVPVNTIMNQRGNSNTLYAGTHLGVYRSIDGGASWERLGTGMPLVNVTDLYLSPSTARMRAATFGRGFWEAQR